MSWLSSIGPELVKLRQEYRNIVPQPIRQYVKYASPLGWAYQGAKATGVGKWLLGLGGAQAAPQTDVGTYTPPAFNTTPQTQFTGPTVRTYTTYTPNYTYWMGQRYNLDNPAEAQAYYNARKGFIEEQYQYGAEQGQKSLSQQLAKYSQELLDTLQQLGSTKERRDVGIAQYFSAVAPSMYQSAEGTNLEESQKAYEEGKSTAQRQASEAQQSLTDWWNDYLRKAAVQKQQELDQITNALAENEAPAVMQRIIQGATPTGMPTYTPINIADYFNRLNQAIGSLPAPKASTVSGPVQTNLLNIMRKISRGETLTEPERQIAVEYSLI